MRVLLQAAGLAITLWLAGCASTPGADAPSSRASGAEEPTTAATVPAGPPVVPSGPLTPITTVHATSLNVVPLQPPADLWERIRAGFAIPDIDSDLVRQHEQWYASRPEYMQRMTDRSRKYLFHIVEELERRGMPSELALLPYIESAFNPQAVSSARAAGMWQFMPATGRDYDLRQNFFRDDRRNVLASTRAALDYLQRLYGMFGDWHLALAAYNWGEGSVSRAIAANKRRGLGTRYVDLKMPAETRNYVPKLLAVKNIISDPDKFRAELPVIENHPYFDVVTVDRDIDIELAAKLADVQLADFKALNPQLNRPVILAAGTPQILLPWDNAKVFTRNLAEYSEGRFASWTAWTVPRTMSVAEVARRVDMSEADLRSVNTIPPRMLIKAGSVLVVPRPPNMQDDVASHVADNGQLALAPEVTLRRRVVRAGKRDSVATIARRYRVTAAQVADWNDVATGARFKPGEKVVVYVPVRAKATASKRSGVKPVSTRKKSVAKKRRR
ncbi:transglycosylase SLT domain-containing protein [Ramlibacter sp.]|uniref:transglycosylase SLT domain-containing protein n=1 Tax=Ramlibacter sp. TaxID=1917967 RepID=UPI002D66CA94|nr:transglycosylase SLT domain-containing protein [Ramlibacter sp.]HYD78053.1 transglycosylase SLT domain-containing protein [Ramlibacter sp.]